MVSRVFIKTFKMINIIFSEEFKNHDTGNHPESIKRIEVVIIYYGILTLMIQTHRPMMNLVI